MAANKLIEDGDYVGWSFTAPPGTTIGSYTLWRSVRPAHGWGSEGHWAHAYLLWEDARVPWDGTYGVEGCVEYDERACLQRGNPNVPLSAANRVSVRNVEVKRLFALMECVAQGSCPPLASTWQLRICAARIGLTDTRSPVLTRAATGSLLDTSAPIEGERSMSFAARDEGGGIARVGISVDGRPAISRSLGNTNLRCVAPYTVTVPCPLDRRCDRGA